MLHLLTLDILMYFLSPVCVVFLCFSRVLLSLTFSNEIESHADIVICHLTNCLVFVSILNEYHKTNIDKRSL